MESEFPSNSNKHKVEKPEPKKIEKVISGEVVRRKKPMGKRFVEMFTGGQPVKGVLNYVTMDVLIPAAKDAIADAVSQGIERMIFGEARSSSRRTGRRPSMSNVYTNYGNRYSQNTPRDRDYPDERRSGMSRRARAAHDFDEIILPTRVEADEVLDRLFNLVSEFESATVSELYELVGIDASYTITNMVGLVMAVFVAQTSARVRDGYLLDLPKPELLD